MKNKLLRQPLDWPAFMEVFRMYDFSECMPDTWTTEDCQIFFTLKGDTLDIMEYMGEDVPERRDVISMPKTVKQAIDSLEKMFGDTWTNEEKEQILDDYECKREGIRKLHITFQGPIEKLPPIIQYFNKNKN